MSGTGAGHGVRVDAAELHRMGAELSAAAGELSGLLGQVRQAAAAAGRCPPARAALAAGESALASLVRELHADAERLHGTARGYGEAEAGARSHLAAARAALTARHGSPHGPGAGHVSGHGGHGGALRHGHAVTGVGLGGTAGSGGGGGGSRIGRELGGAAAGRHPAGSVLARAAAWAAHPVPYDMGASHQGWRADCSGFVSMAWGLNRSYTTPELPGISRRIATAELRGGDILLNSAPGAAGHVVLFDRWANAEHTAYVGYEQSPGGTKHRVIPYPYFAGHGSFEPYRRA